MFLFWYRISWNSRYDRYSFYCCGFMTCASLPFYRKSSSGFGIFHSILTFCRRGLAVSFYIDILLRFIVFVIHSLWIFCISYLIITSYWVPIYFMIYTYWFPICMMILIYMFFVLIYFVYMLYSPSENELFIYNLCKSLFCSLPLGIRLVIIFRLCLLLLGLCDDLFSDYLYATSGGDQSQWQPSLPKGTEPNIPKGTDPGGNKLPPINSFCPDVNSPHTDRITWHCENQLRKINSGETDRHIFDQKHDFDSCIEPNLQGEFLRRYVNSGDTRCIVRNGMLWTSGTGSARARMTPAIFDAVKIIR